MFVRPKLLARPLLSAPTLNWYTPLFGPIVPEVGWPSAPQRPVYDRLARTYYAVKRAYHAFNA